MRKESRVVLTEEQHAVLTYAAEMEGMAGNILAPLRPKCRCLYRHPRQAAEG